MTAKFEVTENSDLNMQRSGIELIAYFPQHML
jgi:hypothetical protein